MSDMQSYASDPCRTGREAIRALDDMSIPPIPAYYEVWFSHLERNNHGLSLEIEKELSSGDGVDEVFLKNIHGKYFAPNNAALCIDDYAAQLLNQTINLKRLAADFDSSASALHKDLDTASTQIRGENGEKTEPSTVLASLLNTAEKAIKRNHELEENLSQATNKIASLQEAVELIATDANTDFLTKLSNRRYFDSALAQLIDAVRLSGDPLCLIVADIDHFKKFNDTWGHQIGDQVLKLVAGTLRENVKGLNRLPASRMLAICFALDVTPNDLFRDLLNKERLAAPPPIDYTREEMEFIETLRRLTPTTKSQVKKIVGNLACN